MFGYMMNRWGYDGYGYGYSVFDWIMTLLAIIVAAFACVVVVRMLAHKQKTSHDPETALDIAKKRYAKGEISKDEFEAIKKDLQ